ncbi:hypothetical protein SBC1_05670 [Caballeronia sp. SBC1]|nr:hypothetical protein SBC2_05370 [Caballeronia sp. SBC2]QIN60591.1 hypothetical protein SBC1_05670 [Caballeronia sp. SBC1]
MTSVAMLKKDLIGSHYFFKKQKAGFALCENRLFAFLSFTHWQPDCCQSAFLHFLEHLIHDLLRR